MVDETNISKYHLKDDQYFKTAVPDKRWICLHHTVSSSGKADIDWWNKNTDKIATAYVIERDGTILEAHDDGYWAWHLGLKEVNYNQNIEYNSKTIGIELVNLGPMVDPKKCGCTKFSYRGAMYWQNYTDKQYEVLADLIKYLKLKYDDLNIKNIITSLDYDMSVFKTNSIFSHRNVNKGKTDVSPAFDFDRLIGLLR